MSAALLADVPGVDGAAVSDWVAAHVPGMRAPLAFAAAGNGRSNLTYVAEDPGGRAVVIRRPPFGAPLESAHDVGREHRVLSALHPTGQPVPRPLALCEDPGVTGAPFFVMERVEGVVVHTAALASTVLDRAARVRAGRAIPQALARLHEVDLDATALRDLARGDDHAGRQLRRWSRQWEASKLRELPLIDELTRRLLAAVPDQPETTLVHGDFTPNNLMLTTRGDVAAILDWELWTLGDPIADVAWLGIWWPPNAERAPLAQEPPSVVDGAPPAAELLATYADAAGRSLDRLGFWTALSYWKLAIIIEGVHRRWREDPANGGEGAERMLPRVTAMAELALEELERV